MGVQRSMSSSTKSLLLEYQATTQKAQVHHHHRSITCWLVLAGRINLSAEVMCSNFTLYNEYTYWDSHKTYITRKKGFTYPEMRYLLNSLFCISIRIYAVTITQSNSKSQQFSLQYCCWDMTKSNKPQLFIF